MIRGDLAGKKAPELVIRKTELQLTGGSYVMLFDGDMVERGSYTVRATADPKAITLSAEGGTHGGRIIRAIFQHVHDRLRICFGMDGVEPTAFATQSGDQRYLVTYRRKIDTK